MQNFDLFKHPLNTASLIEASAGTGKTHSMVQIYLRLLLGLNCEPLEVEKILVVTFTINATSELKDRIRESIHHLLKETKKLEQTKEFIPSNNALIDTFLEKFITEDLDLKQKIKLLQQAQTNFDMATIFTIDGFIQRVLYQHAFESGISFDTEIQNDPTEIQKKLAEQVWREEFYHLDSDLTSIIQNILKNPSEALAEISTLLQNQEPKLSKEQEQLIKQINITKLIDCYAQAKKYWQENGNEMCEILQNEINTRKSLNGRTYTDKLIKDKQTKLNNWQINKELLDAFKFFTQEEIISKTKQEFKDAPLKNEHFKQMQIFADQAINTDKFDNVKFLIIYNFFQAIKNKIYNQKSNKKSFNEITQTLHNALYQSEGNEIARKIREIFHFAMIDEFQDTNALQYQIFNKIFIEDTENYGFIMIGDPKQSIYKFRGADIFSYLKASQNIAHKATLNTNYRSNQAIVDFVNDLFTTTNENFSSFIYKQIEFQKANAHNQEKTENAVQILLLEKDPAKQTALHIASQLQTHKPEDIAILVNNKNEAKNLKRELNNLGIACAYLSEDSSIFSTSEAKDLKIILSACLNPLDKSLVTSAIATKLWNFDLKIIKNIALNENLWNELISNFLNYKNIWQEQGILSMLNKLLLNEKIIARHKNSINFERVMTNVLHLGELLQEKSYETTSLQNLLTWFRKQITQSKYNKAQDNRILRLTSENNVIKIFTVHASKGLQFPIVWLPFLSKYQNNSKENNYQYQDENGNNFWNIGNAIEAENQNTKSRNAESLRLLYVAVTRAENQLNLVLPEKSPTNWEALYYLLSNTKIGILKKITAQNTTLLLEEKNLKFNYLEQIENQQTQYIAKKDPVSIHPALEFNTKINQTGIVTSFSAIQQQGHQHKNLDEFTLNGLDIDQNALPSNDLQINDEPSKNIAFLLPRSAETGSVLHEFLEKIDFQQDLELPQIEILCKNLKIAPEKATELKSWLENVFKTKFGKNQKICLADCKKENQINEWQFLIRLKNPQALKKLMQIMHNLEPIKNPNILNTKEISGFIKGFIDCIVEIDGLIYIFDYKTNFLGSEITDYSQENIHQAIAAHHYDLQYLIYSVAVYRLLKLKNLQHKFGGIAYLFMRGMNGKTDQGVFFYQPEIALLEELDKLFA